MAEELNQQEETINSLVAVGKLAPYLKALIVGSFVLGAWVAKIQFEVAALSSAQSKIMSQSAADHEALTKLQGALEAQAGAVVDVKRTIDRLDRSLEELNKYLRDYAGRK